MRRFDKKKQMEQVNLLSEQRYLLSKGVISEGMIDTIKQKLAEPINTIVDKVGDRGEALYNNLVNKFGENPSLKDIQTRVNGVLGENLKEDRFDSMGVSDNPKFGDKDGKQNIMDKVMSVVSQVAGINLVAFGGIPLGGTIGTLMSSNELGSRPGFFIGALASLIISALILSLGRKYGRQREVQ